MSKKKLFLANNPLFSGPTLVDRERIGVPYRVIEIGSIDPDPNQPRREFDVEKLQELSNSIKTYGVLSPILVRPGGSPGRYNLIAGERRFRASQLAGLQEIPAIVDQVDGNGHDKTLALQLVENLQRSDLSPLERAHAIGALRDGQSLSIRDIAEKLGISKSMVQRSLQLLDLPDDLLNALKAGVPESKILRLAEIPEIEIRAGYLKDIDNFSRSKLEDSIRKGKPSNVAKDSSLSPEDLRITDEIQRALGVKVKMNRTSPESESGRLIIDFYSTQDLQEIFRKLVADAAL